MAEPDFNVYRATKGLYEYACKALEDRDYKSVRIVCDTALLREGLAPLFRVFFNLLLATAADDLDHAPIYIEEALRTIKAIRLASARETSIEKVNWEKVDYAEKKARLMKKELEGHEDSGADDTTIPDEAMQILVPSAAVLPTMLKDQPSDLRDHGGTRGETWSGSNHGRDEDPSNLKITTSLSLSLVTAESESGYEAEWEYIRSR